MGTSAASAQVSIISATDPVIVSNESNITAAGDAIFISTANAGNFISLSNTGRLIAGSNGINTLTTGDFADLAIDNAGFIRAEGLGIIALTTGIDSDVLVENSARIVAGPPGPPGFPSIGIFAQTILDSSAINVATTGGVSAGNIGVFAQSIGAQSAVEITATGGIRAGLDGALGITPGDGVLGLSVGDFSDVSITTRGAIEAGENGIEAQTSGLDSDVIISSSGNIQSKGPFTGVFAATQGHDSSINVRVRGSVDAGFFGVFASSDGDRSEISVRASDITSANDGIRVTTTGADSDVTVTSGGAVDAGFDGIEIVTSGEGADIEFVVAGSVAAGGGGFGVYGAANLGRVDGRIDDAVSGAALGVFIGSRDGASLTVTAKGSVTSGSGFALDIDGGSAVVTNGGLISGFIDLTDQADEVNNRSGALFRAEGESVFRSGEDIFSNTGAVRTADSQAVPEIVRFEGLEFFVNGSAQNSGGLATLEDDGPDDRFELSGNFAGFGDSRLAVDTFLGGPGSISDLLIIEGDTDGSTIVLVNNTNPLGSSPNFLGIPVIQVTGDTSDEHFDLAGPLNAGFFAWDLYLDAPNNEHELRTFGPGTGAFQFPIALTAAQDLWAESAGVWLERQADLRDVLTPASAAEIVDGSTEPDPRLTPGLWAKAFGAWIDRDKAERYNDRTGVSRDFDLSMTQSLGGLVAGVDFGQESLGDDDDGAVLLGASAGYINSDVDFNHGSGFDFEGPTLGGYATYLNDGFYLDALAKVDFLDLDIDENALVGGGGAKVTEAKVRTLGVQLGGGYRFALSDRLFVEPDATLSYAHTEVDDFSIFGGTVSFADGESLRARAGLRIGGRAAFRSLTLSPDVTIGIRREFLADNQATIAGFAPTIADFDVSDNAEGTAGEVSLGVSVASLSGWSGFMRGKIAAGDDYLAATAHGGIRYAW